MRTVALGLFILLFTQLSGQSVEQNITPRVHVQNHFFSFGLTGLYLDWNTNLLNVKWENDNIYVDGILKAKSNGFFFGPYINYEYHRPKTIYVNFDLCITGSESVFSASIHDQEIKSNEDATAFFKTEIDLGYTFLVNNKRCSPVVGFASYFLNDSTYTQAQLSALLGGVFVLPWSPSFTSGINIKLIYSWGIIQTFQNEEITAINMHPEWGTELSLPLYWHIADSGGWDIKVEPYFLKLSFSDTQNIYGTRVSLGINF